MNERQAQKELQTAARAVLDGSLDLVAGVRRICALRVLLSNSEDEVFYPIRAVDSETDWYPLGSVRVNCSPEFLKQADAELNAYLSSAQEDVLAACRRILSM